MKVQQTLAQTWKRRRDSDHAEAKRLIPAPALSLPKRCPDANRFCQSTLPRTPDDPARTRTPVDAAAALEPWRA